MSSAELNRHLTVPVFSFFKRQRKAYSYWLVGAFDLSQVERFAPLDTGAAAATMACTPFVADQVSAKGTPSRLPSRTISASLQSRNGVVNAICPRPSSTQCCIAAKA